MQRDTCGLRFRWGFRVAVHKSLGFGGISELCLTNDDMEPQPPHKEKEKSNIASVDFEDSTSQSLLAHSRSDCVSGGNPCRHRCCRWGAVPCRPLAQASLRKGEKGASRESP